MILRKLPLIPLLVLNLLISGCLLFSSRFSSNDPFYRGTGELDFLRFPLVKPYDAIKGDENHGWSIDFWESPFTRETYYSQIKGVEKIAVVGEVIFVYSPYKEESAEGLKKSLQYWFVLDSRNGIEKGFETEDEFLEYIKKYTERNIEWIEPDEIFTEFEKTGCLVWIPDCNSLPQDSKEVHRESHRQ